MLLMSKDKQRGVGDLGPVLDNELKKLQIYKATIITYYYDIWSL